MRGLRYDVDPRASGPTGSAFDRAPASRAGRETVSDIKRRPAAGGGVVLEIAPDALVGWVNRFGLRNGGMTEITSDTAGVGLSGTDGTTARIAVPFPPVAVGAREPVEAVLDHLAGLGPLAVLLVRAGAHSMGVATRGVVDESSTRRAYVQGRTAAGGWSQQRYARRRDNQLTSSLEHAADLAARVLVPELPRLAGLVVGGDPGAIERVLADRRLAGLAALPRRSFPDIPEPRRAVLDEVASRALTVEITVRPPG